VLGLTHPDDHGQSVSAVMNSRTSNTDSLQADCRRRLDRAAGITQQLTGSLLTDVSQSHQPASTQTGDAIVPPALLQRLSLMPVRIEYNRAGASPEQTMALGKSEHQHTPEDEHQVREAALDETIAASFPASDPASSTPNPEDHSALERARPGVDNVKRRNP
jgi:hypothetical protein